MPLPEVVAFVLAEHLRRYPPVEVRLPWRSLDGKARTDALVFTTREQCTLVPPLQRQHLEAGAARGQRRADQGERDACAAPLLRRRPA